MFSNPNFSQTEITTEVDKLYRAHLDGLYIDGRILTNPKGKRHFAVKETEMTQYMF
jgi:hypothetical protein